MGFRFRLGPPQPTLALAILLLSSPPSRLKHAYAGIHSWSYGSMDKWRTLSNSQCGGSRQSPIDIVTGDTEDLFVSSPFEFKKFDTRIGYKQCGNLKNWPKFFVSFLTNFFF